MKVFHFLFFVALRGANSNLVFRKHVFINTPMTWTDAQDYCKRNYVGLSVIDTLEEYNRFTSQTTEVVSVRSWIGLRKNSTDTEYSKWRDGTMLSFTSWGFVDAKDVQHCISTAFNLWTDFYCDSPMPFFCSSGVVVVEEKKTWDEALEHCRIQYVDLISMNTDNVFLINNLTPDNTASSFWIGLHFLDASWFWGENKPLGSQVSSPSCPNPPLLCGAMRARTNTWENRDCNEKMNFACLC